MGLGDRIKEARKCCGKTQQAFADAIGIKRNTVTSYETGAIDPSDRTIMDICREFNVNEEWLRTGEGDMFLQRSREEELAAFFGDILSGEPDFKRRLISVLARLSSDQWEMLEDMANKLVEEMQKEKPSPE